MLGIYLLNPSSIGLFAGYNLSGHWCTRAVCSQWSHRQQNMWQTWRRHEMRQRLTDTTLVGGMFCPNDPHPVLAASLVLAAHTNIHIHQHSHSPTALLCFATATSFISHHIPPFLSNYWIEENNVPILRFYYIWPSNARSVFQLDSTSWSVLLNTWFGHMYLWTDFGTSGSNVQYFVHRPTMMALYWTLK